MTCSRFAAISVVILVLSACGSNHLVEDHYYSLVLAANKVAAGSMNENTKSRLIVGPVQLPDYLGERGLPMQVGPNRIESAKHHFWAEPLDAAIAKVLVRDIADLTSDIAVERDSGRYTSEGDCRLRVEFDAFHPTSESRVVTSGRYWILSDSASHQHAFSVTRTLTIDGYDHAVDVLRDTLQTLAERISIELHGVLACMGTATS